MNDLLEAVRARLPYEVHRRACRAALLSVAGFDQGEIAGTLGVTTRTLYNDRAAIQRALIDVLRSDGYTDREAELVLGTHFRSAA